jgi:hypothetical protein
LDVISQGLKTAPLEEQQPLSTIQAMVAVPMKARRRLARRGKRPMAF